MRHVAREHYSAEQVTAWAPAPPDADSFVRRARDGRTLLVAVAADDQPIAYGDLEANGHIDHLYCSPEAAGSGIAKQLYEELERLARSTGLTILFVEASEPAKRFFERQGFEVIRRIDFELQGVRVHNYAMQKALP